MATLPDSPHSPPEKKSWSALVSRARTALPPPLDIAVAVRARLAHAGPSPVPAPPSLAEEFVRLFASWRTLLAGSSLALAIAAVSCWQTSAALAQIDPYARLLLLDGLRAWATSLLS